MTAKELAKSVLRILIALFLVALCVLGYLALHINMPGKSYRGPLADLSVEERALAETLRAHVTMLAEEIGPRAMITRYPQIKQTEAYIEKTFADGGYTVSRQEYEVVGKIAANIEVERKGDSKPEEIIIIGGHYDTVPMSPGANDNGTGVAATLVLANALKDVPMKRTVRFVCFVNEEPPYFHTDEMGSMVYAKRCRERDENIVVMISMETMGYFRDAPGSQKYPVEVERFYPTTADFIGFIGDPGSRKWVRKSTRLFRKHAQFPSEGAALPQKLTGLSDNWSFWQYDYPALMVTDTAMFRFPHYHMDDDTPDKCDFERLARVVGGLVRVIEELANE